MLGMFQTELLKLIPYHFDICIILFTYFVKMKYLNIVCMTSSSGRGQHLRSLGK